MEEDQKKLQQWSQKISRQGKLTRYPQELRELAIKVMQTRGLKETSYLSLIPKATLYTWLKKQDSKKIEKTSSKTPKMIDFKEVFLATENQDNIELKMPNGLVISFKGDKKLKLSLAQLLLAGGH
mgnify:CR=1 FL=1